MDTAGELFIPELMVEPFGDPVAHVPVKGAV
jgi:hypothetical protein